MVNGELQTVEYKVFMDRTAHYQMRQVEAYVFGEWAAHRVSERDAPQLQQKGWQVTHLPTGAIGLVSNDEQAMIEAARRLAAMSKPPIEVVEYDVEMPEVEWQSAGWTIKMCRALKGLDIFAVVGPDLITVEQLARRAKALEKRQKAL